MSYIKKQYQGLHFERTGREALEKQFAAAWQAHCEVARDPTIATGDVLRQLLCPSDVNPNQPPPVTDRDREVAATMIQWLGSPVGQAFLAKSLDGKRPTSGKGVFGRRAGRGR